MTNCASKLLIHVLWFIIFAGNSEEATKPGAVEVNRALSAHRTVPRGEAEDPNTDQGVTECKGLFESVVTL